MNPSVDAAVIAEAYERDPASASAEYDHPPGQHDDLANAALGALAIAEGRPKPQIWAFPGPDEAGWWEDTGGHWKPLDSLADGFLRGG
jgi:hypothetical protein